MSRNDHLFLVLAATAILPVLPVRADVQLMAVVAFEGSVGDKSNLNDRLSTGQPHNQLGGFSAIDYLGGDRYLILSDRGPGDGAARFRCRWHTVEIPLDSSLTSSCCPTQLKTTLLRNPQDDPFTGFAAAIEGSPSSAGIRFDPEGLRAWDNKVFVSEEYGPLLLAFSADGRQIGKLTLPAAFSVRHPSSSPTEENTQNQTGRQSNRGPEGLAITPSGRTLVAAMQGPLLQDAVRLPDGKLRGRFARLVAIDVASNSMRAFVYPLEDSTTGISEILAVNEHEFLVLERDSTAGTTAKFKRITRIDVSTATDVIGVDSLPPDRLSDTIKPVSKTDFLDFLAPKFGLVGEHFPEKLEGLTFGPRLADGRITLVVSIDNDFEAEQQSLILCFAVTRDELPGYGWQR